MTAETASAGKEGWIASALARFESPLLHYAAHITRDMELARDVVQDTFLQLCLADRARIEPALAGWLFAVCRNRALNVCRKEARMTTLDDPAQDIPAPMTPERLLSSVRPFGAFSRSWVPCRKINKRHSSSSSATASTTAKSAKSSAYPWEPSATLSPPRCAPCEPSLAPNATGRRRHNHERSFG